MSAPTLRWPPAADEPRLATIESFVLIRRQAPAVFEFVTNASLWHFWHPATASVSATPPRPLGVGEQVTESIRAGARSFSATWTVLVCEPPALWVIATDTPQGAARIVYELRDDGALTRFFRTLSYRSHRWPWSMFDHNLTRLMLHKQSERALANLKHVLEGGEHG
jgi:Polyketide cyclase / dehydrase and lipid transport